MLAPNAAFFTTVTTPTFVDVNHPVNNRVDASYQVSLHLAEGFPRRRLKCEKLTDDGRQVMMAKAHFAFGKVS